MLAFDSAAGPNGRAVALYVNGTVVHRPPDVLRRIVEGQIRRLRAQGRPDVTLVGPGVETTPDPQEEFF
jgi:hypothetical protein